MPSPTREIVVLIVESNAVARNHASFITKPDEIWAELFAWNRGQRLNSWALVGRNAPPCLPVANGALRHAERSGQLPHSSGTGNG